MCKSERLAALFFLVFFGFKTTGKRFFKAIWLAHHNVKEAHAPGHGNNSQADEGF